MTLDLTELCCGESLFEGGAASLNVLITSFEPMLANNSDKSFALSFFDKYHSLVIEDRSCWNWNLDARDCTYEGQRERLAHPGRDES